MTKLTQEYLEKAFNHFAELCDGEAPLYALLSAQVAQDAEVRGLASHGQERQPPVNLLFGAVQFLLLDGVQHELASFYPSVGGHRNPNDAWSAFRRFCIEHATDLIEQIAKRRVQTNEVGRCGLLLPAFGIAERGFERPLALIEVGASAGLNLFFDHYRYEYSDGHTVSPPPQAQRTRVGANQVIIRTELRGDVDCPIPEIMPRVVNRTGVDIDPVDVTNDDAIRWVEALIWPDHVDRHETYRTAVTIVREIPPRIVTGDALDLLPELMHSAPVGSTPCVYHSHAIYQMSDDWRLEFERQLKACAQDRDFVHISLEWLKDDPGPELHLTTYRDGHGTRAHLASCHHHGRWIEAKETGGGRQTAVHRGDVDDPGER